MYEAVIVASPGNHVVRCRYRPRDDGRGLNHCAVYGGVQFGHADDEPAAPEGVDRSDAYGDLYSLLEDREALGGSGPGTVPPERVAAEIVNAASEEEVENVTGSDVKEVLERLVSDLDDIGIDITDEKRDIQASLTELQQARTAFLQTNKEESTVEKLTPWDSSTKEEQEEGHKNYRMQSNKLNDRGVFEVGPPTGQFTSELRFDADRILRDVEDQEQRLRQEITDSLRAEVDNLDQETVRELDTELTNDPTIDGLSDVARDAFWNDIEATDDIGNGMPGDGEDIPEIESETNVPEVEVNDAELEKSEET